jgi:pimeloyl-ACP methyl ester carboxylesterase
LTARNKSFNLPIMLDSAPQYFTRQDGVRIAFRHVKGTGTKNAPTLVFLPGYMSDMMGSKALALEAWAIKQGHCMLRLDYSGCGESEGVFADSTFEIWRDDVVALIELVVRGPVILIGSSMGGWLMLMVALKLGSDVKGLVGIAAAPDFTDWGFTDDQRLELYRDGVVFEDNPYGPEPTPTYRTLFESGQANRMLSGPIPINCPVRLIQGQADPDVPWQTALKLADALASDDVRVTLIKDGDHRLSREVDIAMLLATIGEIVERQASR